MAEERFRIFAEALYSESKSTLHKSGLSLNGEEKTALYESCASASAVLQDYAAERGAPLSLGSVHAKTIFNDAVSQHDKYESALKTAFEAFSGFNLINIDFTGGQILENKAALMRNI